MGGYVTVRGPIFDGRAGAAARDFERDWEDEYGHEVERAVHSRLNQVLRHQTGNYQRHVHTVTTGNGAEVNDSNIIYGPWLEGTGSRNRTTRFKGYATFRLVAQQMDRKAAAYARQMLPRFIARMQ